MFCCCGIPKEGLNDFQVVDSVVGKQVYFSDLIYESTFSTVNSIMKWRAKFIKIKRHSWKNTQLLKRNKEQHPKSMRCQWQMVDLSPVVLNEWIAFRIKQIRLDKHDPTICCV